MAGCIRQREKGMSAENEALIRRWFEEVWNQKKAEAIDAMLAPDVVAHGLGEGGGPVHGREGFKAVHTAFVGAIPDIHITVDEIISAGDLVATHFTCRGTHTGDHLGFAATGKPVIFPGMVLSRIRDGQIIGGWNVVDFLSLLQQTGKVPPKMSEI
jgi:steroid delta-isomerase-like uncharacterized protein